MNAETLAYIYAASFLICHLNNFLFLYQECRKPEGSDITLGEFLGGFILAFIPFLNSGIAAYLFAQFALGLSEGKFSELMKKELNPRRQRDNQAS